MMLMPLLLLPLLLFDAANAKALMPLNATGNAANKIPIFPPAQQNSASVNPEDINLFTNMFLSLLKGTGDWRNQVAIDTVQSVWQSPPIVDYSHRLFST
ncbi:uncharacterized protein Dvir_GJ24156 [Drosophila virilis]|uniref:Uncharacterized protein n=1 Tax=Drosophila virilis TaxID=7244 RepID=B4M150_DROVI|nr:uncharacterized protein Dvir_GJ24156 [Drosophila virilis]